MGQYEPEDSRDVTLSSKSAPGEPERTGFREGETRQQNRSSAGDKAAQTQKQGQEKQGQSQMGYGNAREEDGQMEQDAETEKARREVVGETSDDPAARAKSDANRPLDEA